ncbi:putative ribonuclease H-like domain-containing protein, partial [Tanacetum coccineum]
FPPYTGNFIPFKPDLTFIDEIVESENMDVITIITPSNADNGDAVEPKPVRKNSFRPPVIEDWNSNDDSEELKYNLFSVSQICDKKNNVLFTDTECLVLSSDFKLLDESQVLLRVPRKDNIYSVDLKSVVPTKGLTCLFAKATIDESNLWHRRLGHINFKNINKLVRGNLVRGLPSKIFEMTILVLLVRNESNTKPPDETSGILKTFITKVENLLDYKVKVIRIDNGTEFKNSVMNQFCEIKGIKREFSVARTP